MYSSVIISIIDLDIMVRLDAYFEYMKILCENFIKYIVPYYKLNQIIILFITIITNEIYYLLLYYTFLLITHIFLK
jgi:hypothetical protein